ncbi:MAG TPA: Fe-S cluster assembly protein SufD [Tepidisphaeraceae bacterium]|jgi:Fe-S cluster assembly protein SufD
MTQLMEKESHVAQFRELSSSRNGSTPTWLEQRRRFGIERFEKVGFPDNKQEEWRFTNIGPIAKTRFVLADGRVDAQAQAKIREFSFGEEAVAELVFVNGRFSSELSRLGALPARVIVESLHDAIAKHDALLDQHLARYADINANPFVALSTGLMNDGALIYIPRGITLEQPIHLLFVDTGSGEPTVSHPRILVVAEDNAEATLVSSFVGAGSTHLANVVIEVAVGNDSRIEHNKLQHGSAPAYHVSTLQARLGRGARFVSHAATLGSKLTRNDLNVTLAGEGAEAILNGLVLIGGNQHCDNHTLLEHAAPNCPSYELYKHVLRDEATGVFKGKIFVHQAAQKTDSKQTSKSLLLSDDASMNSQPALEIYADDVKCTHGSTTGPVDDEMVFYLRSRGVSLEAARHLLTYAFAADITRRIKVEPVRRRLEDFMARQAGLPQDLRITDLGEANEAHRT